ncbi:hypothetical protein L345_03966, partial [Ophiophagus hannah]
MKKSPNVQRDIVQSRTRAISIMATSSSPSELSSLHMLDLPHLYWPSRGFWFFAAPPPFFAFWASGKKQSAEGAHSTSPCSIFGPSEPQGNVLGGVFVPRKLSWGQEGKKWSAEGHGGRHSTCPPLHPPLFASWASGKPARGIPNTLRNDWVGENAVNDVGHTHAIRTDWEGRGGVGGVGQSQPGARFADLHHMSSKVNGPWSNLFRFCFADFARRERKKGKEGSGKEGERGKERKKERLREGGREGRRKEGKEGGMGERREGGRKEGKEGSGKELEKGEERKKE